jgi:hypothetical protein
VFSAICYLWNFATPVTRICTETIQENPMKAYPLFILIAAISIVSANPRPFGFLLGSKPSHLQPLSLTADDAPATITAQDLQGFWVIDSEDSSLGSNEPWEIKVEYFFNGNGNFEYRAQFADLQVSAGDTSKILVQQHGTGKWRMDADSLYLRIEACMETGDSDCLDSVSSVSLAEMEMEIVNGRKTLDGLLYAGPTQNFKLPPLLPNPIFKAHVKRTQVARNNLVLRFSRERISGTVIDLAGRRLSSIAAGGMTVTSSPAP